MNEPVQKIYESWNPSTPQITKFVENIKISARKGGAKIILTLNPIACLIMLYQESFHSLKQFGILSACICLICDHLNYFCLSRMCS